MVIVKVTDLTKVGAEQILALSVIFLAIAVFATGTAIVKQETILAFVFGIVTVAIAAATRAAFRMMKNFKAES